MRSEDNCEKRSCNKQGQRRKGRRCSRCQSTDSPVAHGEDHGETGCPTATHGGPQWSRSPPAAWGGLHAGAGGCALKDCSPWERPTLEQGKSTRRKEWKGQCITNRLQPLFPIPLHHLGAGGRGDGNEGVKLGLGRRRGGRGEVSCFSFVFVPHPSTQFSTDNKFN